MSKKRIAIATGGLNEEREISLKSAAYIKTHLPADRYESDMLLLDGRDWYRAGDNSPVDKDDFSIRKNGKKHTFDGVVLMIHGSPVEDGRLQGYFEMLDLPYSASDTLSSALTFNKQLCKDYLQTKDVAMARSILLRKGEEWDRAQLPGLGLPLFVKPNQYGSSVGISKVKTAEELEPALRLAWEYDEEIMAEEFIDGREFSCGVFTHKGEVIDLPVTEIRPYNEFFDYGAKYKEESDEITPAELEQEEEEACRQLSARLYKLLRCKGVVRFDYIERNGNFLFLEANTVPGLSPTSIVPQQVRAMGWTDAQFVEAVVEEMFRLHSQKPV